MGNVFWLILLIPLFSCHDDKIVEETEFSFDILRRDKDYVIIIGDTQYYTDNHNYAPSLAHTIDWISEAKNRGYSLQAIVVPGDLTNYNSLSEWRVFHDFFFQIGREIPVACTTGNHDYDFVNMSGKVAIDDRNSSKFDDFIVNNHWVIEKYKGSNVNALFKIRLLDEDCFVLMLEFGPRDEVLVWANELMKKYYQTDIILITHAYLYNTNSIYDFQKYGQRQNWNPRSYLHSKDVNDGAEIWEKVVKYNTNIKMVICGHNSCNGLLITENFNNKKVLQIMYDATGRPNGGDGWIQILEFEKKANKLTNDSVYLKGFIFNPRVDSIDILNIGSFDFKY